MTTKPDLFSKEILTICKNAKAMKRLFKFAMFVALAATTFTACQKDNTEPNELGGGKLVKMTFHAGNPEIGTAVRTEMEGLTPYWSVGDVIGVSTDGTTKQAQFTNDATERAQRTTFTGEIETSDVYYAYYPYTSNGLGEAEGNKGAKIDLPSNQSPTATSFDGKADILVSQPISGEITSLKFRRLVGIAKIVLKDNTADNLLNGQHVSSLTMTVSDKNLAGRCIVDLLNYTMYEPYYNGSKSIQATYTAATTYPIDGTGASYLCVYPQELAAESTLTIEASTEGYSIKKEITLPSAIKLEAGKITTLNIGLTEEHLTAEAAGLALPFSDDFSWINTTSNTALKIDEYPEGKYTATAYTYMNSGCLKFGSSKYEGYFTTAALDLSREFTVIVNAKRYNESKASLLSITAGNATKTAELQAEAQDFVFQFEPQGNKSTVKVEILEIDDPRGYVYRFDVVQGHDYTLPPILDITSPTSISVGQEGDIATITYNVQNPVEGVSVTAEADVDWINSFDYTTSGEVSFIVDANNDASRTGVVTLSYEGAESKTVTVQQIGASSGTTWLFINDLSQIDPSKTYAIGANKETSFTASSNMEMWNGTTSSAQLVSSKYEYIQDALSFTTTGFAEITLEIVEGVENGYYIKVGDQYLCSASKSSSTTLSIGNKSNYWILSTITGKDGFVATSSNGQKLSCNKDATKNPIRLYKATGSYYNGIYFFEKN